MPVEKIGERFLFKNFESCQGILHLSSETIWMPKYICRQCGIFGILNDFIRRCDNQYVAIFRKD